MGFYQRRGFTLVELLVVIAIIGLLSTIAVVSLGSARNKSVASRVAADLKNVQTALESYTTENGNLPTVQSWANLQIGMYMPTMPTPPAGITYTYCMNGNYYLLAAIDVVAGVEPTGLAQTVFTGPTTKCGGTTPFSQIPCDYDTIYCFSNTTTAGAWL